MGWWQDFTADPEVKRKRQAEAPGLAEKLYSMGLRDPALINTAVDTYVKTGNFKVPSSQQSFDGSDVAVQPVRLGKRVATYDESTGTAGFPAALQGADQVLTFKGTKPEETGMGRFYAVGDDGTPKIVKTVPIKGGDKFIPVSPKPVTNKPKPMTAQDRADLQTIAIYQRSIAQAGQKGQPVSSDLTQQAVEAARRLKLPAYDITQNKPITGLWESIRQTFGADPRFEEEHFQGLGKPPADLQGSPPPAGGKQLTQDKAAEFLRLAGGDKEKARQMARSAGFAF